MSAREIDSWLYLLYLLKWKVMMYIVTLICFTSFQNGSFQTSPLPHPKQRVRKSRPSILLPSLNIAPENRPPQNESSLPTIYFQVRAVNFQGGRCFAIDS